jgi:hypothetical protein
MLFIAFISRESWQKQVELLVQSQYALRCASSPDA